MTAGANWAGNHVYGATALHRPSTVGELQDIVSRARRIRVLGSRHSFSDIADSAELVSLDGLSPDIVVDAPSRTVSVGGAVRYGELAAALASRGFALHNLASLPHISVAGAVATATHGSGDANGNLATAVAGLELVSASGEIVTLARGDAEFDGAVVALGALGAVTRLVLDVEPEYDVSQRVFEGLAWDALYEHLDEITGAGCSVSSFSRLGEEVEQVWVKSRFAPGGERGEPRESLYGATAATVERHPITGLDPVSCSAQLGVPGPWWDRLPHFRMGFTPSSGEELQSEYLVPRAHAVAAIQAVRALGDAAAPVLLVCEIRSVAADGMWMSPQHGRDTIAIHFTGKREPRVVEGVLARIEAALEPFGARPHWGKVFLSGAPAIAASYERLPDFAALVARMDPSGVFRNDWLERKVLGAA